MRKITMLMILRLLGFGALLGFGVTLSAQDSISVRVTPIAGNLYMLDGAGGFGGGNMILSVGEDGVLLVDDMYAMMAPKIRKAIETLSDKPVRIVLNTHVHQDHIQGNAVFGRTAVVIAQENVRPRLLAGNRPDAPTTGLLPQVTFADSLTVYFNEEVVQLTHFARGHTDGDAVIYFTRSRTLHLGDMFFNKMFPAVYAEGGGDIRQLIVTLERLLVMIPADAHVVPGHGDLATMADLTAYVAMLKETVGLVDAGIRAGKTLEDMKRGKILAKYDALGAGGAQTTEEYLGILYKLLGGK